jgi:LPXTG-site transpeptidase (sortase) family protein
MRNGETRRALLQRAAPALADGPRFALSWLLAAGLLLLATVLLGTGSIAWAELRRPATGAPLDPARYDARLDVPRGPVARASFGVGPLREVPPAVLRIPRLQIEVAVHGGTDAQGRLRGAGLLAGSAAPGSSGHVGLALQLDRHFRRLRELVPGDMIALDTADRTRHYRVTQLTTTPAPDASLLRADGGAMLSLVTSHPDGQSRRGTPRFVVRAELVTPQQIASPALP